MGVRQSGHRHVPGGTWTAYENIDMCGQGDVEIIRNWRSTTTIEALQAKAEAKGYSAIVVSSGVPSFGHAALKYFPFQLTPEHCRPISQCCHHPCTIYIYTPPVGGGGAADVPRNLDGHYFSFKTGGRASDIVDRFEARQNGTHVTFYRNGPVGSKTRVESATARPMESFAIYGAVLQGPVSGTVQSNGDVLWSHGYTSRLEAASSTEVLAGIAEQDAILQSCTLSLQESTYRAAMRASETVCFPDAAGAYWEHNPSGQPLVGQWLACDDMLDDSIETAYQFHLATGEMHVMLSLSEDHKVDFNLVALCCKDGQEHPLRRVMHGSVDFPVLDAPHPWYLEKVHRTESAGGAHDWLTNAFFFRAFQLAVLRDGGEVGFLAEDFFSFQFNSDFRNAAHKLERRGGVLYEVPRGWKRFALNVKGKYPDGNAWMRNDGAPGEWAVAYHGTKFGAIPKIIRDGFRLGIRHGPSALGMRDSRSGQAISHGICCTPNLKVVECFANGEESDTGVPPLKLDGHTVLFALQCRVRPGAIRRPNNITYTVTSNDEELMGIGGVFEWVIEHPADIRPYAVLVRECPAMHQNLHALARSFAYLPRNPPGKFDYVPGKIDMEAQVTAEAAQMHNMDRSMPDRLTRHEARQG